jgi:hypothetical protein
MFTKGLVTPLPPSGPQSKPEGAVAYKFVGAEAWDMLTIPLTAGGYYENSGTTCAVNLDAFQTARAFVFVDLAIDAETMRTTPVAKLKVRARFPLTGAKAAIVKLIAACRPIRLDIANKCGL